MTTPVGARDTRIVGAFRLMSTLSIGVALFALGRVFDGGGSEASVLGLMLAVAAAVFAFAEVSYGGRAARAEERRLRRALLTRQFSSPPAPGHNAEDGEAARIIQMMTDNVERLTEYRQVYFGATLAAIAILSSRSHASGCSLIPSSGSA